MTNLSNGEAKAVYKNTTLDLRQYKRIQMFVHANAFEQNTTGLEDGQLSVFVRLGSDYKSNFYEYEIPLKLTAPGKYDRYSTAEARKVWPEENMLDIDLKKLTDLKKERNKAKANGQASYNRLFSAYDSDKPKNKISVMGNPTLGESKDRLAQIMKHSGGMEVTIRIGPENEIEELKDCSLVTATYRVGNHGTGTLGIIGPTRMNYQRVVTVMDYMGQVISRLLSGDIDEK